MLSDVSNRANDFKLAKRVAQGSFEIRSTMTPDTKSDYQLMSAEQQNARGSRMKHVIFRACTLLMDN